MNHESYFMSKLTDEAVWEHLQVLLREYSPDIAEKREKYLSALIQLDAVGGDAQMLSNVHRAMIVSDALVAFQKGLEANLYHFYHPQIPTFAHVDFEDMYQECVMLAMPKREAAEKIISTIEREYFKPDTPWCELIREYIIDLEVTIPKLMHFEGYKAGNTWFGMTIPGYKEDHALTSTYEMQLFQYFG